MALAAAHAPREKVELLRERFWLFSFETLKLGSSAETMLLTLCVAWSHWQPSARLLAGARRALVRCDGASAGRWPLRSRSTGRIEQQDSRFAGADERRSRLHAAMVELHGPDAMDFISDASFAGSAALRCYDSFIYPRSAGALAASEKPSRARVIANQIAFHVRELRAHRAEWLRNVDVEAASRESTSKLHDLTIVLDNLRSAHNVGSIFRLAECAGLAEVITTGITPAPPHPALLKTALGTAERVRTRHVPSALDAVVQLQARGVRVCAAETVEGSLSLFSDEHSEDGGRLALALRPPLALVLGNELVGVDARVLRTCDSVIHLPTFGVKNSLNVATCASALVYDIIRRWHCTRRSNMPTDDGITDGKRSSQ